MPAPVNHTTAAFTFLAITHATDEGDFLKYVRNVFHSSPILGVYLFEGALWLY